jgi:WD40 repeat protein
MADLPARMLVIDPGSHNAKLNRLDIDANWRTLVTGSDDKTIRIWDVATGAPSRSHTIRLPGGPRLLGAVYAVAIDPDGTVVAAGGYLTAHDERIREKVFLINPDTGQVVDQIRDLSGMVFHLVFSPDSTRLVATLSGGSGMRLFRRCAGSWREIARDEDYLDDSFYAAFAGDGRFATTSWDGHVRLYDPDGGRQRTREVGGKPAGLAFSPDGGRIAVAFWDEPRLLVMDGQSLADRDHPGYFEFDFAFPSAVDWSADGTALEAGIYDVVGAKSLIGIADESGFNLLSGDGFHPFVALRLSPQGERLTGTMDSFFALDRSDGTTKWKISPKAIDWRGQRNTLGVSFDGTIVDFGYGPFGGHRARFNVSGLDLALDPPDDGLAPAPLPGTPDERPLPRSKHEQVRSLADHPHGKRSVVGASWTLRAIHNGTQEVEWRKEVPGEVWAVNISGDGRIVLAACGDGTLRWYRMKDGEELLALFPMIDRENWVAWTPEGIYDATAGARRMLRWHINRGWDLAAQVAEVSDIPGLHRPDVIRLVLPNLGIEGAIAAAELTRIRDTVQRATTSGIPEPARLHILAIGVSTYRPNSGVRNLRFAHQDALDLTNVLYRTQRHAYKDVFVKALLNEDATKIAILDELNELRAKITDGTDDLVVIFFSGHGRRFDERLFLIPHDFDGTTPSRRRATALGVRELHDEIARMTADARVLLLLDACHSGGAIDWQGVSALNARDLRTEFDLARVAAITSTSSDETSIEHPSWANGAFTEALLESLRRADNDRDGLITAHDLHLFISDRVPQIVAAEPDTAKIVQRPDSAIRFAGPIFVSATDTA